MFFFYFITKKKSYIKNGHSVYLFFHIFINRYLYVLQEPNNLITVKSCDDTDYSKQMVLLSCKNYFYSLDQPDYCLCVSNVYTSLLELCKCDDQAKLEHTFLYFKITFLSLKIIKFTFIYSFIQYLYIFQSLHFFFFIRLGINFF